ncbi:hypothetical protein RvY_18054 [Ramazzottius varieornatus]|uniref:Retrotransposon gag domain-containing protein n=1 Tax=Ramazzottius varieornatus TaxID=947166 RepID=A0A1D1W9T2_RAMVA|nr:hypothetical protein RvY_18054 [Ramazzottius varieornatus]
MSQNFFKIGKEKINSDREVQNLNRKYQALYEEDRAALSKLSEAYKWVEHDREEIHEGRKFGDTLVLNDVPIDIGETPRTPTLERFEDPVSRTSETSTRSTPSQNESTFQFLEYLGDQDERQSIKQNIIECTGKDAQLVDDWVADVKRCRKSHKWDDNICIEAMYAATRDKLRNEWNRIDDEEPLEAPEEYLTRMKERFGRTQAQSKIAMVKLQNLKFSEGDDFEKFFDDVSEYLDMSKLCRDEKARIMWITNSIEHPKLAEQALAQSFKSMNEVRAFCTQHLELMKRISKLDNRKSSGNDAKSSKLGNDGEDKAVKFGDGFRESSKDNSKGNSSDSSRGNSPARNRGTGLVTQRKDLAD